MAKDIHKFPSELAERFQVRMPDGLRDKLRDAATANNRSMNAEIIARLEDSLGEGDAMQLVREQSELIREQGRQNREMLELLQHMSALLKTLKEKAGTSDA